MLDYVLVISYVNMSFFALTAAGLSASVSVANIQGRYFGQSDKQFWLQGIAGDFRHL